MKLQFKQQKFQMEAAKAVVDVFAGQPYMPHFHSRSQSVAVDDQVILKNLQKIQREYQIEPSEKLEGTYNLTIEMETGVGKTYTYIKTMYELNKHYGWNKFIIVVPSIAIREGVYKSFQMTQEHFAEEYGKKIRFFIYNSTRLFEVERFASDHSIHVMIINAQAFNAKGKDARRIYMELDEFGSRRPIDIIAETNPIVIIDEPQSVEGMQTRKNLEEFHPLMTLRYSATHRSDSIYNMVYRLDAVEAYHKKLVKKIAVKGIQESGTGVTNSYVYLEGISLSKADPSAILQFHMRGESGVKSVSRKVKIGFDLYQSSGELEEYKDNFIIKSIDGCDDSIEFVNGIKIYAGDVIGKTSELQLRRIQIRETILSHIERERQLFKKGIKVLSLFFIDEVEHYRKYDNAGNTENGIFAEIFEQEYEDIVQNLHLGYKEEEYMKYLQSIHSKKTHAGYFSIDKKGRMVNSKMKGSETSSDDVDAYDLIMKNKELLLERDPEKSPVRFIFSHSALKEGWDNPNVFQICTLKQSSSEIRKRQEVGRGMRLCVNEYGERMDEQALGTEIHDINVLTVIASESYETFAKGIQSELAESLGNRSHRVTEFVVENARNNKVELQLYPEKLAMPEFQSLWNVINAKTAYVVDFDTEELVNKAVAALNNKLHVQKLVFTVETGILENDFSLEKKGSDSYSQHKTSTSVKYDLVGKLVEETKLTRTAIVQILKGIQPSVFDQFKDAPEEFILQAAKLINDVKAVLTLSHITYDVLKDKYDETIFTDRILKGKLNVNAIKTEKHLYDHVIYDSVDEQRFVQELESAQEVAVYVKLPASCSISTPLGQYEPGWAIAFKEDKVKYTCVVADIKGTMDQTRIHCASEHFKAISDGSVKYMVVDSYQNLLEKILRK